MLKIYAKIQYTARADETRNYHSAETYRGLRGALLYEIALSLSFALHVLLTCSPPTYFLRFISLYLYVERACARVCPVCLLLDTGRVE